jgi:hypothetical protein
VAGGVEDEGHHEHLRAPGGAVEALVEQHLGMLDEADLDAPVRVAFAPLGGEIEVSLLPSRPRDRGRRGGGWCRSWSDFSEALRKRWAKVGS